MKSYCLAMIAGLFLSASAAAVDDTFHPYHPGFYRSAHASLAPGSAKWFRPGYGYQFPYDTGFRLPQNPYLSQIADEPRAYAHVWLIDHRVKARALPHNTNRSSAGIPWYSPADVFPVLNPKYEFGRLK